MHDQMQEADGNLYFPSEIFSGYGAAKTSFIISTVNKGRYADVVVMSHINLLVVGWLIKKINPKAKIILMAHGIEIWDDLYLFKRKMLQTCHKILCVSTYTLNIVAEKQRLPSTKLSLLNNCLDPFLKNNTSAESNALLRHKYGFKEDAIVLFTLTRLTYIDRYKGYNLVINAMVDLVAENNNLQYLLAGGYSENEKKFINNLIEKNGLTKNVVLAGYVPEEELANHFSMVDIYVMPSTKEGFGIVFIEAMYYGLPVIAGNKDGSTDALLNGKVGLLIEPNSVTQIQNAIRSIIKNRQVYKPDHSLIMSHFGYETYKRKLEKIIDSV